MKSSIYISLGLLAAVVAWMLSGAVASVPESQASAGQSRERTELMKVRVLDVDAQQITSEIVIQGALEPLRQVELKTQTGSRVSKLLTDKGQRVESGELLVKLAEDGRIAQLKHADAEVVNQRLEVSGARKLHKQGLLAENRLMAVEAALAAAEADRRGARLELSYVDIKAPFGGVLEERYVELGSQLDKGERVALLVDESVLKAVGRVSQQSAGKLQLGQSIRVRLLDGRETQGRVTYISRVGDAETHSFRVEAEVANPQGRLNAGVSAEIRIAVGSESAHFLSPAVLSLDDTGEVGVKSVDGNGVVVFHRVSLVRTEANGVWVSGLPARARVITRGQGFVSNGETVIAVPSS